MSYWKYDPAICTRKYTFIQQPHYPARIPPKEWPDMKLIGKAMVRGWATPCRYWPRPRRGCGFQRPFVFPGISNPEYGLILAIMRQEE